MTTKNNPCNVGAFPLCLVAKYPVVLYYGVVLATNLPELAFILSVVFCEDAYQNATDPASSRQSQLFGWFNMGALFVAFLSSGTSRSTFVLSTIMGMLVLSVATKVSKLKKNKTIKKAHAKTAPASGIPPLRVQAPQIVTRQETMLNGEDGRRRPQLETMPDENGTPGTPPPRRADGQTAVAEQKARPWRKDRGTTGVAGGNLSAPTPPDNLASELQDIFRSSRPNDADDKIVQKLVNMIRKSIISIVPEANIAGYPLGNLSHLAQQGLKPEIEIVCTVSPEVLTDRLKAFFLRGPLEGAKKPKCLQTLLPEALNKTAMRVLSERFNNMKYWRSQFTGPEPKTVLLAPASLGICGFPVRVAFSVNNPFPKKLASVLAKGDRHSQELISLVSKWSRNRGICNIAKGHLPIYGHTLLVINFLRQRKTRGDEASETAIISAFAEFANFYKDLLDHRAKPLCVRFLAGYEVTEANVSPENKLWGIPYIEDPYDASINVASTMSAESLERLRQEFARAAEILAPGVTTLAELLEHWIPPIDPYTT